MDILLPAAVACETLYPHQVMGEARPANLPFQHTRKEAGLLFSMRELIGDVAARDPHKTFYFISTGVIHGVDIMCGHKMRAPR